MTTPNDPRVLQTDIGLLDLEEEVHEVVLTPGHDDERGPYPPGTFVKIGSGMVTLVLMIVATYLVPALDWARPWVRGQDPVPFWNLIGRELLDEGQQVEQAEQKVEAAERMAAEAVARAEQDEQLPLPEPVVIEPPPKGSELPPYEPHPDDGEDVPQSLELPEATALDSFFAKLARTDAGYAGEITRISHWGDSAIANDNISSAARFELQRRFGDAGHGFHLVAKPNPSYRHQGARFSDGEDWSRCYIINECKNDGLFGLGGTTVWSAGGAESQWKTEDKLAFGRKVSRFEVWYRAQPRGGNVRVKVDGEEPILIDTKAETAHDDWHTVTMSDDAHTIGLRASGGGQVRLYGVVLEREGPGVVWDGMEQLGAFSRKMLLFDDEHLRTQLTHRDPDLLVFTFGGNDLMLVPHKLDRYEQDFTEVLRRFRGQDPARACVVMAPVDHGVREGQRIVSRSEMPQIVEVQRRAALSQGCAFFDTVAAMGGDGAAGRWRQSNPALLSGDLAHLTYAGQKVIGRMLYLALMERYVEYRQRTE